MAHERNHAPERCSAHVKQASQDEAGKALLCTKQVARLTGLSPSFFEKGRTYGYGPNYVRLGRAIRYRQGDVQKWMDSNHHAVGGAE